MKLVRNNTYDNDILFIDGHGGTGKILLSLIVSSYEGVEKHIEDEHIYMITRLYRLGKLSEDAAISFLKTQLDRRLIYLMLSRQINIKPKEIMSVFKYPYPLDYLKRFFIYDKYRVDMNINDNNPMFQTMTQNALTDIKLHLKTFDRRLKVIYILRDPMDVIYSMYMRRFDEDIGRNPSNIRLTFRYKKHDIPIYAMNWKDKYLKMKSLDRIIRWIYDLTIDDFDAYKSLSSSRKKQIMFVEFDEFISNPIPICKNIEEFIGRDMTWKTKKILKREKCPRRIDYDENLKRTEYIVDNMDDKSADVLKDLNWRYHRWIEKY